MRSVPGLGLPTLLAAAAAVTSACVLVGCGGPAAIDSSISQSALTDNDEVAFDYFLGKGLTAVQAAGIVGNLDQESSMSPGAAQPDGPGHGIAQWSAGARWNETTDDNVAWYAAREGQSALSLQLQLEFIWYELSTFPQYGLSSLERATTVSSATSDFATDYEVCGACNLTRRVDFAEAALSAYGKDSPVGATGSPSDDAGASCTVPSLGQGQCILTSACAALPGHVATAGFCPGADDVQCCTGPVDAGAPNQTDAATDDANPDARGDDAAM